MVVILNYFFVAHPLICLIKENPLSSLVRDHDVPVSVSLIFIAIRDDTTGCLGGPHG